jgi:hypothetical protein
VVAVSWPPIPGTSGTTWPGRSTGATTFTLVIGGGMGLMRLVTLGVGVQNSPRFAPAGLLVAEAGTRVMIDGGPGAEPWGRLHGWLVIDEKAELIASLRRLAAEYGLTPRAESFRRGGLLVERRTVVHTNHPAYGYRIHGRHGGVVVWAPEFFQFPLWASGADVMFAEAAGWAHPVRSRRWRAPQRAVGGRARAASPDPSPGLRPHRAADHPGHRPGGNGRRSGSSPATGRSSGCAERRFPHPQGEGRSIWRGNGS